MQSELVQFMIDQEDEDCPEVGLHLAAWQGRLELVQQELARPAVQLNSRVRPFLATPLRLAATGRKCYVCLRVLRFTGIKCTEYSVEFAVHFVSLLHPVCVSIFFCHSEHQFLVFHSHPRNSWRKWNT